MLLWNAAQLALFDRTPEVRVSPLRADRVRYARPTIVWAVVVDGELAARAYYGTGARWYRTALAQGSGRITVAGQRFDVSFTPPGEDLNVEAVDAAYRRKYATSQQLRPMIAPAAAAATVVIRPGQS